MTLRDAIERYIAWRRAHGAKFVTSAVLLRGFREHVGGGPSNATTSARFRLSATLPATVR